MLWNYFRVVLSDCNIADPAKEKVGQMNASSPNNTNSRREVRVAFTLAIVIIVFTACWFLRFGKRWTWVYMRLNLIAVNLHY